MVEGCRHRHLSVFRLPGDDPQFCLDCERWVQEIDVDEETLRKRWRSYWGYTDNTPWIEAYDQGRVGFIAGKPEMVPVEVTL